MMRFIETQKEYQSCLGVVEKSVNYTKSLPGKVFRDGYQFFLCLTFDELFMRLFFNHLVAFLNELGEDQFFLLVTEPSPDEYSQEKIERYKAVVFNTSDSDVQFIKTLNQNSGGVPPDCIMDHCDKVVVMSQSRAWAAYGERDSTLAVCAFKKQKHLEMFKKHYGKEAFENTELAAKYAYAGRGLFEESREFITNYT